MPDIAPAGFNNAEQPKPISGYRKLTEAEINHLNTIKAAETEIARLCGVTEAMLPARSEQTRQLAIARTEFEGAFMRLCRAVANPASPWTA